MRSIRRWPRAPFSAWFSITYTCGGSLASWLGFAVVALALAFVALAAWRAQWWERTDDAFVESAVEVRIDAYPGTVWEGHVESFSPTTGAKYALIRPEAAAGHFTKVVQRVPVKIALERERGAGPLAERAPRALAAGLSAEVSVVVE